MKLFKMFAISVCLLAVCMFTLPSATADDWDHKTKVTFTEPIEVPGVGVHLLPAGTYIFKILDSPSDRHIVQIFNEAQDHVLTTILAIPNYRLRATDKTVITFRERPVGQPEALKAWFYPGREWGEEFVYAKSRAVVLAQVVKEPVLATSIELEEAPIEALKTAPVVVIQPTGEVVELAQVEPPPMLPHTASPLPLIGLLGMLSMGAGFAASLVSKRSA
jgi:hypothetical protein